MKMSFDHWLDEATAADLDALAQCLADGRITSLGSAGAIQRAGFNEGAVALLLGLDGTSPITGALSKNDRGLLGRSGPPSGGRAGGAGRGAGHLGARAAVATWRW